MSEINAYIDSKDLRNSGFANKYIKGRIPTSPNRIFKSANTANFNDDYLVAQGLETDIRNLTIRLNSQVVESDIDYIDKNNLITGGFLSNREIFHAENKHLHMQNTYDVHYGIYFNLNQN